MDEREKFENFQDIEFVENVESEAEEKTVKKKKPKRFRLFLLILSFIAFFAVTIKIMIDVNQSNLELKKENKDINQINVELEKKNQELEEEKNQIIAEEVERRLAEIENAKEEEMLVYFKNGMSENTLEFLREAYGDTHLVYQQGEKYLFRKLLDVEMADYSAGEFVVDPDTGLRSFQVNGTPVTKNVIDVSKYQGEIDWKAVKEFGIDGAMIRVGVRGYGSGAIVGDSAFDANIKEALENDIQVGAYFFSEAITVEEAKEEAKFILDALKPYKIQLPVVIDLEEIEGDEARNESLSKEKLTEVAMTFLEMVEDAGYEAMLYGNIKTISEMVDYEKLQDYGLWFAYYSDEIYVPYKVDMWQYSSSGKVPGVETDCDMNMMFMEE